MTKLNREGHKHKRKEGTKSNKPANYLIEDRFSNSIIVEKIELKVQGTARSTKVLVNEAIALAKKRRIKRSMVK